MSEGGEARNHEADEVEVVARVIHRRDMSTGRARYDWDEMQQGYRDDCLRHARVALDAVRCAQGRDTDAPERSPQGEDHERRIPKGNVIDTPVSAADGKPLFGWQAALRAFDDAAMGAFDSLRDEEWPEHAMRQAIAAYLAHVAISSEIDRLRAGISFVRGLCTDRASYSVIDERLGELLDGETK